MLSLLSLRRYKEVWVFIKDSNGSRPSSAGTAKLVELFFTPSVLLQKPRWTFSIAVLSIRFNSSISELLFNQINRCIGDNHICEKWKQKKYLNILKNFFSCQFLKVVHTHSPIHCMVKAGTHQLFGALLLWLRLGTCNLLFKKMVWINKNRYPCCVYLYELVGVFF